MDIFNKTKGRESLAKPKAPVVNTKNVKVDDHKSPTPTHVNGAKLDGYRPSVNLPERGYISKIPI